MQVMCVQGHNGLLEDGNIYTVSEVTSQGNFLLEEVDVPEGYTSFSSTRFVTLQSQDDWSEEMEESYWAEQPPTEYTA